MCYKCIYAKIWLWKSSQAIALPNTYIFIYTYSYVICAYMYIDMYVEILTSNCATTYMYIFIYTYSYVICVYMYMDMYVEILTSHCATKCTLHTDSTLRAKTILPMAHAREVLYTEILTSHFATKYSLHNDLNFVAKTILPMAHAKKVPHAEILTSLQHAAKLILHIDFCHEIHLTCSAPTLGKCRTLKSSKISSLLNGIYQISMDFWRAKTILPVATQGKCRM